MMDNPSCDWVRARLPLHVGVGDDPGEHDDEGGDLCIEDRRSIDRHLGTCLSCRRHRADLEQALAVLAGAGAYPPLAPEAPSLWPALERRIQTDRASTGSPWSRAVHGVSGWGLRAWAALDGDRPLRFAWMQDSLREAMGVGRWWGCKALRSAWIRGGGHQRDLGLDDGSLRGAGRDRSLALAFGGAAASLVLAIGLRVAHQQRSDAESTIHANAIPLAGWVVAPVRPKPEAPAAPEPGDHRDIPPRALAQAEPIRLPEAPPTASEGHATSKAVAPPRVGYDLEHGIPMPPDARDSRPVY
jgi:hypothetical protein